MMWNYRRAFVALAVCATSWTGMSAPRVLAQPNAAVSIGVVDDDAVSEKYVKYNETFDNLKKRGDAIEELANTRALLKDDEAASYEPLVLKAAPTADDTTKLAAFTKTAETRRAEYTSLNGKVEKNDADKVRIKELNDLFQGNGKKSDELYQKLRTALDKQVVDARKQYSDNVKKVVGDVAKERKFTLVVMASSVMWNAPTVEITDEVLKRLNK